MNPWDRIRPAKRRTRELAASFSRRNSALYLPADRMKCVQTAEEMGMISKDHTHLYLVEQKKDVFARLQNKVKRTGWSDQATLFNGKLEQFNIPKPLDFVWIDLNGTLSYNLVDWIKDHLALNLQEGAVVCLTQEYCWRNNVWLKELRDTMLNMPKWYNAYSDFRNTHILFCDKYISFPPFLMTHLLSQGKQKVELLEPIRYSDTIDMMFFRFVVSETGQLTRKEGGQRMAARTAPKRRKAAAQAHTTRKRQEEPVIAADVINAFVEDRIPRATRLLNKYVEQQKENGYEERHVRAAIKAHVTRRTA